MKSSNTALFDDTNVLPWYHGRISNTKAERFLSARTDGLFLVRDSLSIEDNFILMVCYNQEICRYKILIQNNAFTIDKVNFYDSLDDLINYYINNLAENVLKTSLKSYVIKKCEKDIVPWNKIKIEKICSGMFGGIMLGACQAKKITLTTLRHPEDTKLIIDRCLFHENLLNVLGMTYSNRTYYLITEYLKYGNLLDLLRLSDPRTITYENKITFAYDISCGMEYLEKMLIPHKLLSTVTVLISSFGIAKLTNFGLSEELQETLANHFVKWKAPETILNGEHTNKSDIWSYGVCLWEICTFGKTPYEDIAHTDIYSVLERGVRLVHASDCLQEFVNIMDSCWRWNPAGRPTFRALKKILSEKKRLRHI